MAPNPNVKLLGTVTSPYSDRVQMALSLKSIEFEFIIDDLSNKSELLLQSNPIYKRVPVLIHGGKLISESLVINEYIDTVWSGGPAIMPADPYDCAIARFWAYYIDTTQEINWWKLHWCWRVPLLNVAKGNPTLVETINIGYLIDIAFGSLLSWITTAEKLNDVKVLNETTMPGLVGWADKFRARDVVKDVPAKHESFIQTGRTMRAKLKAMKN